MKKVTNKDLENKIDEIIDNIIKTGKDSTQSILELISDKASQLIDNLFNKNIEEVKQKIKERLLINEKSKS